MAIWLCLFCDVFYRIAILYQVIKNSQMNKVSIWLKLLSINYFLFCSTSFNIIARTFSGSPNSVMNPSASWWS